MSAAVVVCAPNAFKGTLTARAAATAIARGVRDAGGVPVETPVADGGDGTLDVLLASRGDLSRVTRHRVTGPNGTSVTARLGWLAKDAAVVELAEASGLRRIPPGALDALHATSRGTGELIREALDGGARHLLIGVGGSASTDGGTGMVQALGGRFLDAGKRDIGPGGAGLEHLVTVDLSGIHPSLAGCSIDVACDIRSPLLGRDGAALMFAAQKGATPRDVLRLEDALTHLASVVVMSGYGDLATLPGAGAAGGCGFGLALIGGRLLSGAGLICDTIGLDRHLRDAALVITGEGRIDAQTAVGKAPSEVAARARNAGIPCVAIGGTVLDPLPGIFSSTIPLDGLDPRGDPRRHARALLRRAARRAMSIYCGA